MASTRPDFRERFAEIGSHLPIRGLDSLLLVFVNCRQLLGFGRQRWMEENFVGSSVRTAVAVLREMERFGSEND